MLLQADVKDMLPAVEEANAISAELDKKKKFEMVMVTPEARGELEGRKKVSCGSRSTPYKSIYPYRHAGNI